jgi:hypothetical protein
VNESVVDLQIENWKAKRRGEIVLYRGIEGSFVDSSGTSSYTPALQTAMYFAAGRGNYSGHKRSGVIAIRIPTMTALDYLVGFNHPIAGPFKLAETYDIDVKKLGIKPVVVLDTQIKDHEDIFRAYDLTVGSHSLVQFIQQLEGRKLR